MGEGSPRRVTVATQNANIHSALGFAEEDDKRRQHVSTPTSDSGAPYSPGGVSRWKKLRTTVQLGNAVASVHRKPPLKREDSFLKRFSTRPPAAVEEVGGDTKSEDTLRVRLARGTVLNPDESFLFWWLWLLTACGLYNGWTLIVRQAFPELRLAHERLWHASDWCSDAVYLLDVAVQFRTGYLEQGIMVRDSRRLAFHYLRSKDFFLDVAAMLPLDLVQRWSGDFPLLRFPRFLKARRIYRFYYAVESRTAYPNLWRVANLIHVLLLIAHWFGCFYYMLSELEGFQGDWAYKHPEKEASPMVRKYLGSVYWSTLTLTTIGDLATPATNLQYLFTIISYLIGVFIFATIVGQVGNVITNRNASRLEFERLLDGAKLYMRHHRVPKGMQRRVQRWYDYSWSRGRMQGGGDIHSALGILPDKLKTELAIHVNLKTLKKVTIFQECQPEFLHDLVLKMKAYIFTPGDLVCRKGEVAREMFIIADGILQVINEKGQVLTQMKAGDFFGEIGILNLDGFNRRTADVRSVGYSELFSLSREDVLSAMKDYPEAEDILQSMGRKRLMEARLTTPDDSDPFDRHSDGSNGNRQRKKGLNWTSWLKNKRETTDPSAKSILSPKPKYSGSAFPFPEVSKSDPEAKAVANHVDPNPATTTRTISSPDDVAKSRPPTDDQHGVGVGSLVGQLTLKLAASGSKDPQQRKRRNSLWKKRSFWCKISGLVRMRRKLRTELGEKPGSRNPASSVQGQQLFRTIRTEASEVSKRESLCSVGSHGAKAKVEAELVSIMKSGSSRSSPHDERRTSWQPQKRSVSNWNRSELFAESLEKSQFRDRRKTLAEGTLLGNRITHQGSGSVRHSVPASLMTGSGLNAGYSGSNLPPASPTPDLSPMSSNYSLTPSTSDDDEDEDEGEEGGGGGGGGGDVGDGDDQVALPFVPLAAEGAMQPDFPPFSMKMQDYVSKIVEDLKSTMDSYIVETEKDMCLRILQLEKEIREKDDTILQLQKQHELKFGPTEARAEEEKEKKDEQPAAVVGRNSARPPLDSTVCSIDVSPPERVAVRGVVAAAGEVSFHEEDLWLVEFPLKAAAAAASAADDRRQKLRRHSSVEVGRQLPYFPLDGARGQGAAAALPPPVCAVPAVLKSPRRFSESQARSDVVPLNTSFAARVRRVFAKVKASRSEDEASAKGDRAVRRCSTGSDMAARRPPQPSVPAAALARRLLPTITESCSFDSLRSAAGTISADCVALQLPSDEEDVKR